MSEYKPIDECRTVEELLADPERWARFEAAYDDYGNAVSPQNPRACMFCLYGALQRIYGDEFKQPFCQAEAKLKGTLATVATSVLGGVNYPAWQDAPERTHAEVLEAVRKAGI